MGKSRGASAKKERNLYLDSLKGLAIILVVLGHSIQITFYAGGEYDQNLLFRLIYSFHMPLFMFLSGAVAAYSLGPMGINFIKKKFYMLVIPFFSWYFISYFVNGTYQSKSIFSYFYQLLLSPDYGLWFLWVLFINYVSLAIIKKLEKHLGIYSYLLFWLAVLAIPTGYYGIGLVKWQLPFFLLGYLIYGHRQKLTILKKPIFLLCIISFPFLALTWHRLLLPETLVLLEPKLLARNLLNIHIGDFIVVNSYQTVVTIYKYAVALSGIGFVFWLMQTKLSKHLYGVLAYVGIFTLDIYAMHIYFMRFAFGEGWVHVITGIIFSLVASLLVGMFIIRKVPILDKTLLGGRMVRKTNKH